MVATRLSEVAGKGWGLYSNPSSEKKIKNEMIPETTNEKQSGADVSSPLSKAAATRNSYYESANESLQKAAASAYTYLPTFSRKEKDGGTEPAAGLKTVPSDDCASASCAASAGSSQHTTGGRRRNSILSPTLLKLIHNPYIGVRGGGRQHHAKPPLDSMDAVRKLLYVVVDEDGQYRSTPVVQSGILQRRPSVASYSTNPPDDKETVLKDNLEEQQPSQLPKSTHFPLSMTPSRPFQVDPIGTATTPRHRNSHANSDAPVMPTLLLPPQLATIDSISSNDPEIHQPLASIVHPNENVEDVESHQFDTPQHHSPPPPQKKSSSSHVTPEETASQLTEGTLRAMRDLALDEAVELHASLKYWSERWERPIFSWFIAGPMVWFSLFASVSTEGGTTSGSSTKRSTQYGGYDHAVMVGQKVSQIQAVLARRLSVIGELQQHLLRAGWQRGVAQWGFLGEGGDWAAVAGTDGRILDNDSTDDEMENEGDEYSHGAEIETTDYHYHDEDDHWSHQGEAEFFPDHSPDQQSQTNYPQQYVPYHPSRNQRFRPPLQREFSEASVGSIGMNVDVPPPPDMSSPRKHISLTGGQPFYDQRKQESLYYTNLHVQKRKGGHIHKDNPALAEWSIDAMALIRRQLHQAAIGKVTLPGAENWPFECTLSGPEDGTESIQNSYSVTGRNAKVFPSNGTLPAWATQKLVPSRTRKRVDTTSNYPILENECNIDSTFPKIGADCFDTASESTTPEVRGPSTSRRRSPNNSNPQQSHHSNIPQRRLDASSVASVVGGEQQHRSIVSITDLPLMMREVSGILDVMEHIIDIQRARRLEKLKPPPWWRQNWFLIAMIPPSVGYLLYNNMVGKGQTWKLVKYAAQKILDFAREHVVLPCAALYDEFTKGPESISDHKARDTAMETLKKMIRSWLDETYPDMPDLEKLKLSDAMDITLIEEEKEQSMKSVYNMNSVIRMSFIEAQFIKKEMMNALVALDEMQASTNFNMNLAAITPFVLLMWTVKKISTFIFYTTFKWGKSRGETYRSFLDALTEIERLLIMRSNPPVPTTSMRLESNHYQSLYPGQHYYQGGDSTVSHGTPAIGDYVLGSDDLGMLMLHIHELRTILWQERRRFSPHAIRSLSEDLAELSGERGAVSVRQQLLIVERMNRAYSFLKQGAID